MSLRLSGKIFCVILLGYALMGGITFFVFSYVNDVAGGLFVLPLLPVYFLNQMGVHGLVQSDGACGWGLCLPTLLGWLFLTIFWMTLTWLAASGLARLVIWRKQRKSVDS